MSYICLEFGSKHQILRVAKRGSSSFHDVNVSQSHSNRNETNKRHQQQAAVQLFMANIFSYITGFECTCIRSLSLKMMATRRESGMERRSETNFIGRKNFA